MQSTFLPSRRTADNIIITQEILHFITKNKTKKSYLTIKIDMEKAFDTIEWSFIKDALMFFNFQDFFIKVIMNCVTRSSLYILVNGFPTNFFNPSRRIRQGDPLSPYLVITCMDYLSYLIIHAMNSKEWSPVFICKNSPPFVDDILVFSQCNTKSYILLITSSPIF